MWQSQVLSSNASTPAIIWFPSRMSAVMEFGSSIPSYCQDFLDFSLALLTRRVVSTAAGCGAESLHLCNTTYRQTIFVTRISVQPRSSRKLCCYICILQSFWHLLSTTLLSPAGCYKCPCFLIKQRRSKSGRPHFLHAIFNYIEIKSTVTSSTREIGNAQLLAKR